ncbi:hypothetical protein K1T71_002530 [Dendrolimus kikuchii]|uniref:Uncharacterized protein n=1 Tax=Dendrolimus kikuchii TaxID=765133 RepID=A0ACC1DCY0_9NEOP|nr:hypothetical protein K1T71_002530 [Dendrolimus kikuchii]
MAVPQLFILLSYVFYGLASQHSYIIPIEGYESELQVLGKHVEIPETPVKIVKITKTVAVKIPVPYPVKVREKVPYPVHVAKPYPVPVPQIIHVPHVAYPKAHHENEAEGGHGAFQNAYQRVGNQNYLKSAYNLPVSSLHGDASGLSNEDYNGGSFGNNHNIESIEGDYSPVGGHDSYDEPSPGYYGNTAPNYHSNAFGSGNYK